MKASTLFERGPLSPTSTRHYSGDRGCQAFTVFHALPLPCIILNKMGEAWERGCVYCQMLSFTNKCITNLQDGFCGIQDETSENLQLTSSCPQHSEV